MTAEDLIEAMGKTYRIAGGCDKEQLLKRQCWPLETFNTRATIEERQQVPNRKVQWKERRMWQAQTQEGRFLGG